MNGSHTDQAVVMVSAENADMRRFISDALGDRYRIVPCADGAEALAKAIASPPDVVVTHLMPPKPGGDRLVEAMRRIESLARLPVLVLSASADEELQARLLAESVQDYLVKPFSAQELRARVRNLVVMKRSRDVLRKELKSQSEDLSELTQQLVGSRRELQRSLNPLRVSEERWHSIFQNSAVGIASTDAQGMFISTNIAYREMVGYTEEELLGMSYMDITLEDDQPANRKLAGDLWEGRCSHYTHEKRYRRKDGRVIWVRNTVSLTPGTETVPRFAMVVVEDITERKQTEDRLREYEKAVEGVEEMIVVVDRQYRYLIANRAFLSYMGLEREQLIGRLVGDMTTPGVFENLVKAKLDECFRGNVVKYELKYSYPARGERDLSVSYFPIDGGAGMNRVACVLQDVTERKQADRALRSLTGRILSLEDEERRRLASELHDTTAQSLAALCMNLSVVSEAAGVLNPRAQAAIAESVALADECLREIRTVSYLLHPLELDELGLQYALSRYIDGFTLRSGIRVEIEVSPDLGRLPRLVETTVFRVVQECLTNIHRHSGSDTGRVRVARHPANLVLEVEDGGSGIRPDAPAGVGIASMRERLQQVNGRLETISRPGCTIIRATIPLPAAI